MNKFILRVISGIGRVKLVKLILRKLFNKQWIKYVNSQHQVMLDAYHNYGLEALKVFHECMEKNHFFYTLAFGSILGAIREHGFIKHDLDIDTYVWIEDYSRDIVHALEQSGFTLLYSYSVDNDKLGKEDTFEYKGVHIDIFYIYPPINKYPYCCDFQHNDEANKTIICKPRRLELPIIKERKLVPFESISVYIPINAEEITEFRYGPSYMVPDPAWHWVSAKDSIVEWYDKQDVTSCRKYPKL